MLRWQLIRKASNVSELLQTSAPTVVTASTSVVSYRYVATKCQPLLQLCATIAILYEVTKSSSGPPGAIFIQSLDLSISPNHTHMHHTGVSWQQRQEKYLNGRILGVGWETTIVVVCPVHTIWLASACVKFNLPRSQKSCENYQITPTAVEPLISKLNSFQMTHLSNSAAAQLFSRFPP